MNTPRSAMPLMSRFKVHPDNRTRASLARGTLLALYNSTTDIDRQTDGLQEVVWLCGGSEGRH